MDKRINLIDADSIIYICAFDKKDAPSIKTLQECKDLVDSLIKNMLVYTKSTHYLLFLTVGKCFRFDVNPLYKANRKYADKPQHFDAIKEYLITKYKAIYETLKEADDLVCIYKKYYKESFISAIDKDILNLEGETFNYKEFKWVNTTKDEADMYFWRSMITGDTVDNIKGIPGKGIVYAEMIMAGMKYSDKALHEQILSEYINHFGEYLGVQEFHKNYMCLKMKEEVEGLIMIEPIEFNKNDKEYELV